MRVGLFGILLAPLWLAMHFGDHFGPKLREPALYAGLAVSGLFMGGLVAAARGNVALSWRCLSLAAAAPLIFVLYSGTSDRWLIDRAVEFSNAEDRLRGIEFGANASADENARWLAEVHRDYQIAKANQDYRIAVARATNTSEALVSSTALIICSVLAALLLAGSVVPHEWVLDAWESLSNR
jgi:hypothetical protein